MGTNLVRCFNGDEVAGMVPYIDNLDHWDGSNHTCGSTGRHMGIGKTKDGRWYSCHGSQWENERDHAEIITVDEAKKLCLQHNPDEYKNLFGEDLPVL